DIEDQTLGTRQIGRRDFADGSFAEDKPNPMSAVWNRSGMGPFSFGAYHPLICRTLGLQVLEKNGGDDGTRTRGLCRDSFAGIAFTTTYNTAGTAKVRGSRARHRILWVGLWVENSVSRHRACAADSLLLRYVFGLCIRAFLTNPSWPFLEGKAN